MNPIKVPNYKDGESTYKVDLIINDFNGLAIGYVIIDNKKQYVVRWNYGIENESNIGFPQSHGRPTWMLLPYGLTLNISI